VRLDKGSSGLASRKISGGAGQLDGRACANTTGKTVDPAQKITLQLPEAR